MAKIMNQKAATVKLIRQGGRVQLFIQTAPELEEVFKTAKPIPIKTKFQTFNWYPIVNEAEKFKLWSKNYYLNTPDKPLDFDQTFNMSFLFIEGISKGVTLEFGELYSKELLIEYAKQFEKVIKEMYNEYVSDMTIEHVMQIKTVSV